MNKICIENLKSDLKSTFQMIIKCSNCCTYSESWTSLVAQMVKNPPAFRKIWVLSLIWEESLEEGMATHSSILAWRIPMNRGAWQVYSPWDHRVRQHWETAHSPLRVLHHCSYYALYLLAAVRAFFAYQTDGITPEKRLAFSLDWSRTHCCSEYWGNDEAKSYTSP